MGAGLSPLLIASASLTYLRFLRLPLLAVAIPLVAIAVAVALVGVAVTVALITVVAVSVSGLVVVTVGVRTVAVIRNTKSTGKDELVTAAPIVTAPIATAPVAAAPLATAPVAAAAECRSSSGLHRHVPMAMAATTTPRASVYRRRG